MEEAQVQQITTTLAATIESQFAAKLDERFSQFQQEMSFSQASCSQQVLDKLNKKTYSLRREDAMSSSALMTKSMTECRQLRSS